MRYHAMNTWSSLTAWPLWLMMLPDLTVGASSGLAPNGINLYTMRSEQLAGQSTVFLVFGLRAVMELVAPGKLLVRKLTWVEHMNRFS